MYRFLPPAREVIEGAGLTQTAIAEATGIDRHHFNKRLNGAGTFMSATTNRIRAFAEATKTQKPAAMQLLFEEFDDGREAKRRGATQ